jgi:hypothetical protein
MKKKNLTIYLDMDGTFANLYGVRDWLPKLTNHDATPYRDAKGLCHMPTLARQLNLLRAKGIRIGVISWLSRESTPDYNVAVTQAKLDWLKKHLPTVTFDEIHILDYGVPKSTVVKVKGAILVDDEARNREEWTRAGGTAVDATNLLCLLKLMVRGCK